MGALPAMPGSQRDSHGCIRSAGYQWCASLNKCLRPFEEECHSNSTDEPPSSADAPNASGSNATLPGSYRDPYGCIPSAGYHWCESSEKCLRPWEEDCDSWAEAPNSTDDNTTGDDLPGDAPGADMDANGCIPSAGYKWCASLDKCLRPWEETCDSWRGEPAGTETPKTPTKPDSVPNDHWPSFMPKFADPAEKEDESAVTLRSSGSGQKCCVGTGIFGKGCSIFECGSKCKKCK